MSQTNVNLVSPFQLAAIGHLPEVREAVRAFDAAKAAGASPEELEDWSFAFQDAIASIARAVDEGYQVDTDRIGESMENLTRQARQPGSPMRGSSVPWVERGIRVAIAFLKPEVPHGGRTKRRPAPPKGRPQLRVVGR